MVVEKLLASLSHWTVLSLLVVDLPMKFLCSFFHGEPFLVPSWPNLPSSSRYDYFQATGLLPACQNVVIVAVFLNQCNGNSIKPQKWSEKTRLLSGYWGLRKLRRTLDSRDVLQAYFCIFPWMWTSKLKLLLRSGISTCLWEFTSKMDEVVVTSVSFAVVDQEVYISGAIYIFVNAIIANTDSLQTDQTLCKQNLILCIC